MHIEFNFTIISTGIHARTDEELMWFMSIACCKNRCLRNLSIRDIHDAEVGFKVRSQAKGRNYVLEYLHCHSKASETTGDFATEFIVKAKHVCQKPMTSRMKHSAVCQSV